MTGVNSRMSFKVWLPLGLTLLFASHLAAPQSLSTNPCSPSSNLNSPKIECGTQWTSTLCTNVTNYKTLMGIDDEQLKVEIYKYRKFLQNPQAGETIDVSVDVVDVEARFGFEEVEYLCESKKQRIFPQAAHTVDGHPMLILNIDERRQSINVEICSGENATCAYAKLMPNGVQARCEQIFQMRDLIAAVPSPTGGPPTLAKCQFKIPSCCKCAIRAM